VPMERGQLVERPARTSELSPRPSRQSSKDPSLGPVTCCVSVRFGSQVVAAADPRGDSMVPSAAHQRAHHPHRVVLLLLAVPLRPRLPSRLLLRQERHPRRQERHRFQPQEPPSNPRRFPDSAGEPLETRARSRKPRRRYQDSGQSSSSAPMRSHRTPVAQSSCRIPSRRARPKPRPRQAGKTSTS
jgi:hypothetical protein